MSGRVRERECCGQVLHVVKRWQHISWAIVLDLTLGDPPYRLHPVRLMGRLALWLENPCRRMVKDEKLAGILAATAVIVTSTATAAGLIRSLQHVHPRLGDFGSIALLYTSLASRDLAVHARAVKRALDITDLPAARRAVAHMVGRDTDDLDTTQVVRATVESVAENTVDGVTSPLFYALLGGAPAAVAFKAISTLDSTFGYKSERYLRFGWASARLDDMANYGPARLSVPFVAAAAGILGRKPAEVIRTVREDGRKHASPNSAIAEAAFASALGAQLGGPLYSSGRLVHAPLIGRAERPLQPGTIGAAVQLMYLTLALVWALSALALICLGRRRVTSCNMTCETRARPGRGSGGFLNLVRRFESSRGHSSFTR